MMGMRNESLKILHVVEHGISLTSGYGFRSQNIFQAQLERGWQPVVLTFPQPGQSEKGYWKQPQTVRAIKYYYRPLSASRGLFPFLALRCRPGALVKRIHELVEIEKPDLLHAHSPVFNGIGEPDGEYKETWRLAGNKIVGYIGSFRRYEGLDLLIKAVAYLSKSRPDVVLLLVGGGRLETESELRVLVDRLGLREKVIMPGWLPPQRIAGVYALIDVLAYPRTRIPLTEIVTPLKPLEAMAMGKPLIASDIGGHRELIRPGHNGVLFTAGAESALADAVSRLLDNKGLCERLGAQAKAWVCQERSWSKTTSVYSEAYEKAQRVNSPRHVFSHRSAS